VIPVYLIFGAIYLLIRAWFERKHWKSFLTKRFIRWGIAGGISLFLAASLISFYTMSLTHSRYSPEWMLFLTVVFFISLLAFLFLTFRLILLLYRVLVGKAKAFLPLLFKHLVVLLIVSLPLFTTLTYFFFCSYYPGPLSEAYIYLNGIKQFEESYKLTNGTYIDCAAAPRRFPDENPVRWQSNTGFEAISFAIGRGVQEKIFPGCWANRGRVRFVYEVIDATTTDFVAFAHGDRDGDGDTIHFIVTATEWPHVYDGRPLNALPTVPIDDTPGID